MNPILRFFRDRVKAIGIAARGFILLLRTEQSIQTQAVVVLLVTLLGFLIELTPVEWMFQLLACGLVLVAEALNTGIEKLSDFVHPEYHEKIGRIKDLSAGAAFIAAVFAIAVGLIIYLPKFIA
jgi:diacylglycerol kinase (ATP)